MALTTDERARGTDGWPPTATAYLTAVEEALAGIDAEERQDLVEDLRAHIDELLEEAGQDVDLHVRLGAPASYAAELVESAGLGVTTSRRLHRRVGDRLTAVRQHRRVDSTMSWLEQLRPAWWVGRGYGLALLAGVLTSNVPASSMVPVPAVLGSHLIGLATTLGLIWLSVEVGAQRIPGGGRIRRLLLVLASIVAAFTLWALVLGAAPYGPGAGVDLDEQYLYEELDRLSTQSEMARRSLTLPGGEPITNIYAFDVEGNRLEGVLLYDGVGNPVVLQDVIDGTGFPFDHFGLETDYVRDLEGRVVPNLFPLTQYRVGVSGDPLVEFEELPDEFSGPEETRDPAIGPRSVPEVAIPPLETPAADQRPTERPDPTPRVPE